MKRRFDLKRALSSNPARLLSDKPCRMLAPHAACGDVHWRKVLSEVQTCNEQPRPSAQLKPSALNGEPRVGRDRSRSSEAD